MSLSGACLEPQTSDDLCLVYGWDTVPGVLLVCCQYPVARQRAAAWARSVLGGVRYQHAVFVGTIAAEQFRGQGDASQEELLFSLRTRAAAAASAPHPPSAPLLPTGTLLGGLPAALLSHCQVRGQSAELLVLVEMVLEGRPAAAAALAGALGRALRRRLAGDEAAAEKGGKAEEAERALSVAAAAARKALGLGALQACDVYA